ncbi:quinol:cytochrome C oxidoreductase [Dyadobacter sandarakinus]|uniref:Quinol:cytochrome C oxidoreductase n=1 Tax=Dyadobacter sandarakinus TaxID=2747268 RepID=A0ABX7IC87_9BACT|nr:quinol:cytochrome C oxidoreductase [Dyadobacter sandarakinus]QRR03142.1 quinol:cytochrome C oxidoreductase [Dyadobacter sandarakinus]
MASAHSIPSIEERFEFTSGAKKSLLIGGGVGVALILLGAYLAATGSGHEVAAHGAEHAAQAAGHAAAHGGGHEAAAEGGHHAKGLMARIWANLWVNGVYFTGMAVVGMFFLSYNYLAQAGWSAVFKRVPEALPAFLPVTGVVLIVTFLFGGHDLFHWTHEGLYEVGGPEYDAIIAGKRGYLNTPFYLIRLVLYFALWYGLWRVIRNLSLQEDEIGGTDFYEKSIRFGTAFLVVFGVTSSTSAWDFVMSVDTHWFSTMFGWYTLASWHVAGLAVITLTIVLLRERGYLRAVNSSHLRDLGKFVFAFSIFWTYVWFAQFLLIYYANLPEETIYFIERFRGHGGFFKAPFFITLFLNFFFPFLVLMTRDAKFTHSILKVACWSVIIGHYLDFYTNIMPGSMGASAGFGPLEVGFFILFLCAFGYSIANQLTKANLIPRNHPMLEESLHHDIA